jgi:hypothetical protein
MDITDDRKGRLGSLDVDGQYVYFAVVMLVNIKILTSTSNYNWVIVFLVVVSIGSYLFFYYILNIYPASDLFGLFSEIFVHNNFIFALFFMSVCLIMVDIGLYHAHAGIKLVL